MKILTCVSSCSRASRSVIDIYKNQDMKCLQLKLEEHTMSRTPFIILIKVNHTVNLYVEMISTACFVRDCA